MIALCKRRERQRPRTNCSREPSVKTADDPLFLPKEPEERHDIPLKCQGFQCLFRLASDGRTGNIFTRVNTRSSDMPIDATLTNLNRTTKYYAQIIMCALRLSSIARYTLKSMLHECISSFCKTIVARRGWLLSLSSFSFVLNYP
jgi:hypothetical protein